MKKYPSTIIVSVLGLLVSLVFGAWWTVSLVSAYVKYHPNGAGQTNPACTTTGGNCSSGALIGILVFFSKYPLTLQSPNNSFRGLLHLRDDQEYNPYHNLWYLWLILCIPPPPLCQVHLWLQYGYNTPQGVARHAALSSFRRCMTYSFGSISFGSLIVSIIQFIKQLASVGRAAAQQEGDTIFQIIFCCLQCLAGFIGGLVQYFNHYAYTQVALFGKVISLLFNLVTDV